MVRWLLIAIVALLLSGCGDSISRRRSAAEDLRQLAADYRSNPENLTPLRSIIDVLENAKFSFDRTYACSVLRELGTLSEPAVPALINALDCGDLYVEREAPRSLGAMGVKARDAVPALIKNLRKTNRDAGWFSAEALGDIGAPALVAIPDLEIAAECDSELMIESANKALKELREIQQSEIESEITKP